jgi:hypothetical protein
MKPEKFIQHGTVAVLYSPGYGAGWSSWAHEPGIAEFLLFDRRIIEAAKAEATQAEVSEFLATIFGPDQYIYTGGWEKITTTWIPVGAKFCIAEYDGSESVMRFSDPTVYYVA